jgi:hypothetical protein
MPNVYEMPLKERFEKANEEFAAAYFRKVQLARTGERSYPGHELYVDLYRAAGNHGLFALALWAYFCALHTD